MYDQVWFIGEELIGEVWLIYVDGVDDGNKVEIVHVRQDGEVDAIVSGRGRLASGSCGELFAVRHMTTMLALVTHPLVPGLTAGKVAVEHMGVLFGGGRSHEYALLNKYCYIFHGEAVGGKERGAAFSACVNSVSCLLSLIDRQR